MKDKKEKKKKEVEPIEPEVRTLDEGFEDGEDPDHRPTNKPGGG